MVTPGISGRFGFPWKKFKRTFFRGGGFYLGGGRMLEVEEKVTVVNNLRSAGSEGEHRSTWSLSGIVWQF